MDEIKVINDSYNLLKWFGLSLSAFPRNHRYGLGIRIENALYDVHKLLLTAKYAQQKTDILRQVNLELEFLRFLVREAFEIKLIDSKKHHAFIAQVDNIGKQLGGWIRSLEKPS